MRQKDHATISISHRARFYVIIVVNFIYSTFICF